MRRGAIETNPLLATAHGAPRWGRIIGFKAGTCAAGFLTEEIFARRGAPDRLWYVVNTVSGATFGATAIHNLGIAAKLRRASQATRAAGAAASQ